MKLVMTLVVRDEVDLLEPQLAFHLNAGVDFVIVAIHGSRDGTTEILESYAREGYVRLLREQGGMPEGDVLTRMARLAADDYGADWLIDSRADEFWWPRAESLRDVLIAIPPRYTVVQALVRRFVRRPDDGRPLLERMTARRSPQSAHAGAKEPLESALQPVFRVDPRIVAGPGGVAGDARRVPLRAWYPIEVFRFPTGTPEQTEEDPVVGEDALAHGLADGSLVIDTRLSDALRTLQLPEGESGAARRFALPDHGVSRLTLRAPDIVDDAAYAVECAEVGEVDITLLEGHIDELERRIAWLEGRFWPRVLRRLSRIGRRPAP